MRFGVPSVPIGEIRGQANAKPDEEKEQARRRLEELEARAATVQVRVNVQTGNGDEYHGPERRQ